MYSSKRSTSETPVSRPKMPPPSTKPWAATKGGSLKAGLERGPLPGGEGGLGIGNEPPSAAAAAPATFPFTSPRPHISANISTSLTLNFDTPKPSTCNASDSASIRFGSESAKRPAICAKRAREAELRSCRRSAACIATASARAWRSGPASLRRSRLWTLSKMNSKPMGSNLSTLSSINLAKSEKNSGKMRFSDVLVNSVKANSMFVMPCSEKLANLCEGVSAAALNMLSALGKRCSLNPSLAQDQSTLDNSCGFRSRKKTSHAGSNTIVTLRSGPRSTEEVASLPIAQSMLARPCA
mmetsp:Transcript_713/g.2949  ORF Transcript_713/g.2949 Transcript_713/m.2949 type:complete len:297 (+) Transcript_713:279-1169(+)